MSHPLLWTVFAIAVLGVLTLDLGVFHRRAHVVHAREAATWSLVWIAVAAAFGVGIYLLVGRRPALEFTAGYLVEEALSVDNLFVFLVLFSYFKVPEIQRHRVLFWGILGALLMRGAVIALGAALLHRFHWIIFLFGAFLVFTGIRMAVSGTDDVEPEHNPALRLVRKLFPVTPDFRGQHFFVRARPAGGGAERWYATPLLIVLVLVETTDLVFAVDSIPAIFGVTRDPFIVYTSNVFAILGLRSLFFLLAGMITRFHLLRFGLAAVLGFVGVKMLVSARWHIPIGTSLGVITVLLGASVVASLLRPAPAAPELSPRTGMTEEMPVPLGAREHPSDALPNEPRA
jgi:tellurite resistance protein TerC